MFKKWIMVSVLCVLATAFSGFAQAQEQGEPDYTSGIVKSISATAMTITESDTEEETETTFVIDSNTILENIASIEEIVAGDEVYVDFVVNATGKVAVNLYKMGMIDDADLDAGDPGIADDAADQVDVEGTMDAEPQE
ncbi:MAG: hypothetical protein KBD53_06915 [Candidatus Omnitrophica bacterium]|nr:hypothetical protein [Candidatus Omnitrophota bacterium]